MNFNNSSIFSYIYLKVLLNLPPAKRKMSNDIIYDKFLYSILILKWNKQFFLDQLSALPDPNVLGNCSRDAKRKLLAPHDTILSVIGICTQPRRCNMAKRLGNQSGRIDANKFEGRRTQDCPIAKSHGRARSAKCSPHGACSLLSILG